MKNPSRSCTPFVLVGLLFLSEMPAAIGCGFHAPLGVQLESMYPGSFPVAVALRQAADAGVIEAAALEITSEDMAAYADTVHRLQSFRGVLAGSPAAAELPTSFSLGYVESRLWARYSQSEGRVRVDMHTSGPTEGEAVVLTGEPVLTRVLTGDLSVDRALASGMLLIDGSQGEKTAICNALKMMFMANKTRRR